MCRKLTNSEKIKVEIGGIDKEQLIEFCGDNNSINILYGYIQGEYVQYTDIKYDCHDCIKSGLESEEDDNAID